MAYQLAIRLPPPPLTARDSREGCPDVALAKSGPLSTSRASAGKPFVQSGPEASMAVHGRPADPRRNTGHSPASRDATLLQFLQCPIHACVGVLLGVRSDLGVSIPWGYRRPRSVRPWPRPRSRRAHAKGRLHVELARWRDSYSRVRKPGQKRSIHTFRSCPRTWINPHAACAWIRRRFYSRPALRDYRAVHNVREGAVWAAQCFEVTSWR